MKILIGTPVKQDIPAIHAKCLIDMIKYTIAQGHEVDYVFEYGGLYDARDRICRKTIRENYDYMLQLDSDQTFPKDALCVLLDKMNVEKNIHIITGTYVGKEVSHRPVLFTELHKADDDAGPWGKKIGLNKLISESNFFEVAGAGAGFLLVSNHALRLLMIWQKGWFKPYEGLGEDVSFCQRATEINLPVYADTSVKIGHIKYAVYTLEDWDGSTLPPEETNNVPLKVIKPTNPSDDKEAEFLKRDWRVDYDG